MRSAGNAAQVAMRVNGETIIGTRSGDSEGAAVSAILMLEIGNWVDCIKAYSGENLYDDSSEWKHNTLAGFLYTQL